jgi:hypothetical protein
MPRRFQKRGRLTPCRHRAGVGRTREFDYHGSLISHTLQRCGYGHMEYRRRGSAATQYGTHACGTQAEKFAKELHRPISS